MIKNNTLTRFRLTLKPELGKQRELPIASALTRVPTHTIIDSSYVRKHLPHVKINPSSTIRLKGIGYNSTSGFINTVLYFLNRKSQRIGIPVVFHVASFISTKVILGSDIVVEQGATVNLADNILTLKTVKGGHTCYQHHFLVRR
jgi:hypothetical protein